MKIIIAGSREINSYQTVIEVIKCAKFTITQVVSGTARGVDSLGERWAAENNIPVKRFPANWDRYGKRAGYLRNKQMAKYADGLIAIWDGYSRGTQHMINFARLYGLVVYIHCFQRLEYPNLPLFQPIPLAEHNYDFNI